MAIRLIVRFLPLALFVLAGCASSRTLAPAKAERVNGISGLAQIDATTYLGIHDELSFEDGPRLTLIAVSADTTPLATPVKVDDWKHDEGRPSDLESGCALPGRSNEFLVVESGYWEGEYGRLFHITLNPRNATATVEGVARLPKKANNAPGQTGDQYEGIACPRIRAGKALLLLGERGGSAEYPTGILRWGMLDLDSYELTFTTAGDRGLMLEAPGDWSKSTGNRDIADLYIDPSNTLWVAASEDLGDAGPFHSVIFQAGTITEDDDAPVRLFGTPRVWREVSGFKIESLGGPSTVVPGSILSIGTEDEIYGGVWRAVR